MKMKCQNGRDVSDISWHSEHEDRMHACSKRVEDESMVLLMSFERCYCRIMTQFTGDISGLRQVITRAKTCVWS